MEGEARGSERERESEWGNLLLVARARDGWTVSDPLVGNIPRLPVTFVMHVNEEVPG